MSFSTATTKSVCLTLALLALSTSTNAQQLNINTNMKMNMNEATIENVNCESCSSNIDDGFESASIILKRGPIHLPLITAGEENELTQRNASVYNSKDNENVEEQFELPSELAAMIAEAKANDSPAAAPTNVASALTTTTSATEDARYYATYSEGELCSSKSASEFDGWEESFDSLDDCCEVAFSWDYDACMGL